ncbi:MAG: esterase-like activity of phytase family protein [Burkholderiales bacterium]|nr:esterase-like activity of phytase family protein [Burkholderiales bacterium]MBP6676544.1 esterase-like activity of phytase family protein [Vitreoscilla sp.]
MNFGTALSALATASLLALAGCGGSDSNGDTTVSSLRLIGQQVLARRMDFNGTVVGGLSGIDYDAANKRYVLISDDRTSTDSANDPRMYTANLSFDANGFTAVNFLSTFAMKQPDGTVYPKVPSALVADPESLRLDTASGNLLWVSEGDRSLTATPARVIDPFIREIRADGGHVREYTLPAMFKMSASDAGPRSNAVFEGITLTPTKAQTVVIMEGALFQDAAPPSTTAGSVSRITVFDRATGIASAQYAYPLDKVQAEPVPAGSFTVNGATEILALSETRFLVLERSFSVGVVGNQVRLYEIDLRSATNVLNTAALAGATYTAVSKRLVQDFETLKAQLGGVANLEGLTFGPTLANGHRSLVVVADDNLPLADSLTDRNQFLVFEVMP